MRDRVAVTDWTYAAIVGLVVATLLIVLALVEAGGGFWIAEVGR